MPSISSEYRLDTAERHRFWLVASLLTFILVFPYFWAATTTPDGFVYSGLLYNPDDQNVHLAWAKQASEGHFFIRDLFTSENLANNERPLFTNLFTFAIGAVSGLTRVPPIWLYHALRLLFAILGLWWFTNLCALLTPDKRTRFLALLLVAFSGGAGWLQAFLPNTAFIDRPDNKLPVPMMPEAFTFTSALIFPLYIASMALLVFIFWQVELARREEKMRPALFAAIAAFVLSNIHTYDVIPLNLVLLVWALYSSPLVRRGGQKAKGQDANVRRMQWLAPLIALAGTILPFLYQVYVFNNSSEFKIKALTPTAAPPLGTIVFSYALLLIPAAIGAIVVWREGRGRLMLLWFAITLVCIYAPVSFARKMIEGLHLPMCFLAAAGLAFLIAKIPVLVGRRAAIAAAVGVLSLSSFQFIGWCLRNASDNNIERADVFMPPLYLTTSDNAALRFLEANARRDRAILCLTYLGNYIPRETGRNVHIGHWAETLNYYNGTTQSGKLSDTLRFFNPTRPMPPEEAQKWLRDNHIGYVVMGTYENARGARLPLELKAIHSEGGTTVYEVPTP